MVYASRIHGTGAEATELFWRLETNTISMVLLIIVAYMAGRRLDNRDLMNGIFLKSCHTISFLLFLETVTCIMNRRPETWLIPVSQAMHTVLFASGPFLSLMWCAFVHDLISPTGVPLFKRKPTMVVPVVMNAVFAILSPKYGLLFHITDANVYQRGPFYILAAASMFLFFIYAFGMVVANKAKIKREDYLPILLFGILPTVGGILQSLFYGVLLMWSCTAFSLIIVYIFLQQRMIHMDTLTGSWTRGSFQSYIESLAGNHDPNKPFGLVFADMNGLKGINDRFGHEEGDRALRTAVDLMRGQLGSSGIIARYGGDEFVLVVDRATQSRMAGIVEGLRKAFDEHNGKTEKPYPISFSFGYGVYDPERFSLQRFIRHLDTMMYREKAGIHGNDPAFTAAT